MRQCFSSACPYASSVARRARIKHLLAGGNTGRTAPHNGVDGAETLSDILPGYAHGLLSTIQGESDMGIFCVSRVKSVRLEKFRKIQSRVPFRKLCQFRS